VKRTRLRHLPWTIALVVVALALAAPALATPTETFHVNSNGNGVKTAAGAACEEALGKCTLRAAIEAAKEDSGKSKIEFGTGPFDGTEATAINLEGQLLPAISTPTEFLGTSCEPGTEPTPCVRLKNPGAGQAVLSVTSNESEIDDLTIFGGAGTGVRFAGAKDSLTDSQIFETYVGVEIVGNEGLIVGNTIKELSAFGFAAIAIRGSSNGIYGNLIEHFGVQAISLELGANANQIGADTPESENVINHTEESPIFFGSSLSGGSRNEVARNHGTGNNGSFIFRLAGNQGVEPPAITTAYPSTASGTATPEATVRVFEAEEGSSNLKRFLGETAAGESGGWTTELATAVVGAEVVATQTVEGATSPFTGVSMVTAEPSPPPSDNGGGSTTPPITVTTTPPAPPPPPTTTVKKKPLVCKKGFKKKKVKGRARCVRVKKHQKKTNGR
jgi:hypothetical protein